jgi:hypothetical protein
MKNGVCDVGRTIWFRTALVLVAVTVAQGCAGSVRNARSTASAPGAQTQSGKPLIVLEDQGSFFVGGRVVTNSGTFDPVKLGPEGETIHGDYAYVQYQIPPEARDLPLLMWPGGGAYQTWESTPDGREGFKNIFVKRGWSTYIFDQPWRGRAGRSTVGVTIRPESSEKEFFIRFRLGIWPNYYPDVQFPRGEEALAQWYAQRTPATGPGGIAATTPEAEQVVTDAVVALLKRTGPAVLFTHSASGVLGWKLAPKTDNIRGIVSFEDTNFVFPEDAAPPPLPSAGGTVPAETLSPTDFAKLTRIPILIIYGDYIPSTPSKYPGLDLFRARREMCQKMVDLINARGGHAEILDLPKIGIRGNTHFPMSDLNNVQIAEIVSKWLSDKRLDTRSGAR